MPNASLILYIPLSYRSNKWNANPTPLPILDILIAKKSNQQLLLARNPTAKELPKHNRIPKETYRIPHHNLRP